MDTAKQLAEPKPWMRDGLCQYQDPDVFFPKVKSRAGYREAREVCRSCGVRGLCLREALENEWGLPVGRRHGVWAGTVPKERLRIEAEIRQAQSLPPLRE